MRPDPSIRISFPLLQTLLTYVIAKQLYGGFRPSNKPNSKLTVSLQDLLSVPVLEQNVIDFLQKAKLQEASDDHNELYRTHDRNFRVVSCVMCLGYTFNLNLIQLRRFLHVARRALGIMRRTIRNMVHIRRRSILELVTEVTDIELHPDDFGPIEVRPDRKPALFNHRFFAVLDKAAKKKSREAARAS